ncbi:PucR family transcriptional regulator [Lentilactobacillus farraginis]|uniref:Sugar diacid utilization regulator n=1 Tax=Lentilactobacillus farraginis DSM 18382 = JCM 14108 TaxID=1423743 RepID=X0PB30_9LACO|nr:PucR family transcriptional regulator [Lentilactobacillus farraginis]KRM12870.1 sugar diacid utilization regulator [Lentilactobacillus farraginis DSM 18382 = JCM 14108]GAF37054.1 sugar diacid utilization regulator [Lentilactobacillus farraginis DSM 18382 = JCM 14108]
MIDLRTVVKKEEQRICQVNNASLQGRTANAITIMDNDTIHEWAKDGEIVITSSRMMPQNVQSAKSVIQRLAQRNICCLMVKPYSQDTQSKLSREIISYADTLNFPLFEIKEKVTYIQLINDFNSLLFQDRRTSKMADLDLDYLLKSNSATDKDFDFISGLKGVDLYKLFARIIRISLVETPKSSERMMVQYNLISQLHSLFANLEAQNKITTYFVLESANGATVVAFFDENQAKKPPYDRQIYHKLMSNIRIPHFSLYEGVASLHKAKNLHRSFTEACFGMDVAKTMDWQNHPIFYRDVSLWELVNQISRIQDSRLYPVEMDQMLTNPEIFETVQQFFNHNESIKETSEALYTHPNTIRYRLNMIYKQTGLDYRRTNDKFLIYIALIEKLLKE